MHSNPQPKAAQSAASTRQVPIPRPATQPKALAPMANHGAHESKLANDDPKPPPAPRRIVGRRSKASPPPLPEQVFLTDADLIDDEITQAARDGQPTSVDVELDCFSCTEPPPESGPRRKRVLFAFLGGLGLVVAAGLWFMASPLAANVRHVLHVANASAAPSPALLTVNSFSSQASQVATPSAAPPNTPASVTASTAPRPKLSTHGKRGKTTVVSAKKPSKTARPSVQHDDPTKRH
jgi:hypothetical protein